MEMRRIDVDRFPTITMAADTVLANQITDCSVTLISLTTMHSPSCIAFVQVCLEEFAEGDTVRVCTQTPMQCLILPFNARCYLANIRFTRSCDARLDLCPPLDSPLRDSLRGRGCRGH